MTSTQANQTTPFAPPKTWEDVLIEPESNENTKELAGIIAHWEGPISSDCLMKAITATPHIALFIKVQGKEDPFLVHLPTIAQGANATPFCIDPIKIARNAKTGRLPYAELLAATNRMEFSQVEVRDPKTMCQIRNVALVPNFIFKDTIRSESRSTINIALVTINMIRARINNIQDLSSSKDNDSDGSDSDAEENHQSEEEKQKKQQEKQAAKAEKEKKKKEEHGAHLEISAKSLGADLLAWLYFFINNSKLTPVALCPVMERSLIVKKADELHATFLARYHQATGTVQAPPNQSNSVNFLDDMAKSLEAQSSDAQHLADFTVKLADRQDESTAKGFKKLPKVVKETLLAAATKDGNIPADKLPESAMEIFAEKIDNGAHLLLQHNLEKQGLYFASISPAASKQITNRNWRWPSSHTPGGVSCLVTRAWSPGIPSSCHETLVLSLRSKHEMDNSTLKKSNRVQDHPPQE